MDQSTQADEAQVNEREIGPLALDEYIKYYGVIKGYMEHESSLVNNRLTWILTIHGFLYATYGFTIQKQLEVTSRPAAQSAVAGSGIYCYTLGQAEVFLLLITAVGALISSFGLTSIKAAHRASVGVSQIFESPDNKAHRRRPIPHDAGKDPLVAYETAEGLLFPHVRGGGYRQPVDRGNRASTTIPKILLCSWMLSFAYLFYMNYYNSGKFCTPLHDLPSISMKDIENYLQTTYENFSKNIRRN